MNNELKGITYASQPQIGIPMAEELLKDNNPENRISASVYLGYRLLDKTYKNIEKYNEILEAAITDSKNIGYESVIGYRWFLSLTLLRSYIDVTLKDHPMSRIDLLKEAYNIPYTQESQICNISKISTLLYHDSKEQAIKEETIKRINKALETPDKLEQLSTNTIKDLILPLLGSDEQYNNTIRKYKNWAIHKDYIRLLTYITKSNKAV